MPSKRDGDTSKKQEKTRLQRLRAARGEDYQPETPPLPCGEYLLDHFWAVGPTLNTSMGQGPLTHSELQAYQQNTGIDLSAWEVSTLMRLSREYMSESSKAEDRLCAPPWTCPEQEAVMRVSTARDLEAQMDSL